MTFLDRRRRLLTAGTMSAGLLMFARTWEGLGQTPQPFPSPNAPSNQNVPGGLDAPPTATERGPRSTLNPAQVLAEVQQLYTLAYALKDEVERTNLRATLPLDLVKKAQQIEKLAKQIKEQAKG